MDPSALSAGYRLVAELLLHPDDRDEARITGLRGRASPGLSPELESVDRFRSDPRARSTEEYVQTLELSPPCPLYLGAYLFDEPTSCRGVGTSGRNAYMLELVGIFRHFGVELSGRELPDYVPALVEFLAMSLERADKDRIGLRRRLLEHHVRPALRPLRDQLVKYQSPYAWLIEALEALVAEDLRRMGDQSAWQPPERAREQPARRLPVLLEGGPIPSGQREVPS